MTAGAIIFLGLCLIIMAFIFMSVKIFQLNSTLVVKLLKYGIILSFGIAFSIASIIIGLRIDSRHSSSYSRGLKSVKEIWGGSIIQNSPQFFHTYTKTEVSYSNDGKKISKQVNMKEDLSFENQKSVIKLNENIRKKGLLYYAGYNAEFSAAYTVKNTYSSVRNCSFFFPLPEGTGNISEISVIVDGEKYTGDTNYADGIYWNKKMTPGEEHDISISYNAQGTGKYKYNLTDKKTQIKNLDFSIKTNYKDIIIPDGAMVPTEEVSDNDKTLMKWKASNLVTSQDISLQFEVKGNYGKIISKMFLYSPLTIFLFIGFMLIITTALEIKLHPMHFLFMLTGFFIYYLLSSYMMSYLNIMGAVIVSLTISTAIVMYYTFLIKKGSILIKTTGAGLGIFQWVFSAAFFFPAHTGFIITIASIISFVVLMKATLNIDWENKW